MLKKVKVINKSDNQLPEYATLNSAGLDLLANEEKAIYPGETQLVGTGLYIELPEDCELQIRSRSGLSLKGVVVANSPGTIDADYRGEVKVILHNNNSTNFPIVSPSPYVIKKGDKIAQAILNKVEKIEWTIVEELSKTDRGAGGFGSTDKS